MRFFCVFALNVRQLFRRKNIFSVLSIEQDTPMSIKKLTLVKKIYEKKKNVFLNNSK